MEFVDHNGRPWSDILKELRREEGELTFEDEIALDDAMQYEMWLSDQPTHVARLITENGCKTVAEAQDLIDYTEENGEG